MKTRAKYSWKWGDLALAGVVILAAALLWIYPFYAGAKAPDDALTVVVRTADGREHKLPLETGLPARDVPFASNGYAYVVRVENGRARVLTADCPDRVCVITGWLSRPGQIAACVPGRLLLRIEAGRDPGGSVPGGVDVVSR